MPGQVMKDGLGTTIAPAGGQFVLVIEKTVTPSGYEDRGEIDTTTLRNTVMVTSWAKALIKMAKLSFKATYDGPNAFQSEIDDNYGVNQLWSVTFPNGGILNFWGQLNHAQAEEHSEGNQPMLDVSVLPTNEDNAGNIVSPQWVP